MMMMMIIIHLMFVCIPIYVVSNELFGSVVNNTEQLGIANTTFELSFFDYKTYFHKYTLHVQQFEHAVPFPIPQEESMDHHVSKE